MLDQINTTHTGDALETLRQMPDAFVNCIITSPPYFGLRDYRHAEQIGLEDTPQAYVARLVEVFEEARRILRHDGTFWLNLGDSYGTGTIAPRVGGNRAGNRGGNTQSAQDAVPRIGGQAKQLLGIPWRVAFALQGAGWWLRQDNILAKRNPMPESVEDRTTRAHEYMFHLTKSDRYWYDADAIAEPSETPGGSRYLRTDNTNGARKGESGRVSTGNPTGDTRNKRSVWWVKSKPYPKAHFATFAPEWILPCVLAGCPEQVCAHCWTPYVRDVEKESHYQKRQDRGQPEYKGAQVDSSGWEPPTRIDRGFKPACNCSAGSRPGIILDPFMGSGTTGLVAAQHGRSYVGIELNPTYAEMARQRIAAEGVQQHQMF